MRIKAYPFLLLAFSLCMVVSLIGSWDSGLRASHIAGGDLTYECLNSCTTRFHLRGYRDCSGSNVVDNTITFTTSTPGCAAPMPIAPWSPVLVTELNALCPNLLTKCTNPSASVNGIQEFYYVRDYDICTVPTCTFTVSWNQCCRTPALSSLVNPGSQQIYVVATGFTTNPTTCNSSPLFDHQAIPYICAGQQFVFPQHATDPDGDSLSYELASCLELSNVPVTYAAGYSATQPLGPSWNVQINSMNGDITFTPLPGNQVTGVICLVVKEWRNGMLIGSVTRDMNITAIACVGNCGSNYVEGLLYHDANNNCIPDPGEARISHGQVSINSGAGIMVSNYQGVYRGWLSQGTYTLEPILPSNGLYQHGCPMSGAVTITFPSVNDTSLNNDFAREALVDCPSMWVSLASNVIRPCSTTTYWVQYCNLGTDTAFGAYVELELEPYQTYVSVSGSTWQASNGSLHTFSLANVPHGYCGGFSVQTLTDCDTSLTGMTACAEAHIHPDSACISPNPIWDQSSVTIEAECVGDSLVCFYVVNTGQAMQGTTDWRLYENSILVGTGSLQLCGGCDTAMCFPANGHALRLEVDQRPYHPGNSHPSAVMELCGTPGSTLGQVTALPLDDEDDFIDIFCRQVVNSYDPNHKNVSPSGVTAPFLYVDSTTMLTYLIDFQNLGTGDAIKVVIEDSLDPRLDILSIQPGASSHPYTFEVASGRRLRFIFDNIHLVPASQDSNASMGWVQYSVRQIPGNTFGDIIQNKADIFFDINAPIRTNTVLNTVGWPALPVGIETEGTLATFTLWPNPADQEVFVQMAGTALEEGKVTIELYSLIGQRLYTAEFGLDQRHRMDVSRLSHGVYIYRLLAGDRMLNAGKLMVR